MEKIKQMGRAAARPFLAVTAMLSVLMLGGLALAGSASATPPADPVSDGFTDLTSKTTLYGAAAVALVIAGILILFGLKWLKRGASKA